MHTAESTTSAPTQEQVTAVADGIIRENLETVTTVGELQEQTRYLVSTFGDTGEIGERVEEYQEAITTVTADGTNNEVRIEGNIGDGALGKNKMGTTESVVVKKLFDPKIIISDTRQGAEKALEVVTHENQRGVGHSTQDPEAIPYLTVVMNGKVHKALKSIEGSTVVETAHYLGQPIPTDLPQETYLEGVELVQTIDAATVRDHLQKDGARVGQYLQVAVWEGNPSITLPEMIEEGQQAGVPIDVIVDAARKQGKLPRRIQESIAA